MHTSQAEACANELEWDAEGAEEEGGLGMMSLPSQKADTRQGSRWLDFAAAAQQQEEEKEEEAESQAMVRAYFFVLVVKSTTAVFAAEI